MGGLAEDALVATAGDSCSDSEAHALGAAQTRARILKKDRQEQAPAEEKALAYDAAHLGDSFGCCCLCNRPCKLLDQNTEAEHSSKRPKT